MKKSIVILGSSGSVGENAVKVASYFNSNIDVFGIAVNNNIERALEQIKILKCQIVAVYDKLKATELKKQLLKENISCQVYVGAEGLERISTHNSVDLVLCAITGVAGLQPVIKAIQAKKDIAIASKEILVMAGEIVMREVAIHNVNLLPVDSEHSAIFQCLEGRRFLSKEENNNAIVNRLIITGSGGPFRSKSIEEMKSASVADALNHPTWNMGKKISIDSATLMNKALEMIEAHYLFNIPAEKIEVVIHPQSIVHSMVEFSDNSVLAQMSEVDMRFPIQYALTYPEKYQGGLKHLDFSKLAKLEFFEPRYNDFTAIDLAYKVMKQGGTATAVLNGSNEVAVKLFLEEKISLINICEIIEKVVARHILINNPTLTEIIDADEWARKETMKVAQGLIATK
ncbi:1-deoxy-D-xylulose-5-phosphate reductoisomerase [Lentisphaerota bacterium WC36G]|nr:1-deoxy-D-xylulose-5-phosphate reductoisomerase [Lentisphaerae bacterium WC36]